MRSLPSTAALLTATVLALCLAGEVVMRLTFHVRPSWFFYATMSGGLLGFVPSAPVLVRDREAAMGFRLTLAVCLVALVLLNCWFVALVNHSDLGWSKGDYMLALPVVFYAIACIAGFYAMRPSNASKS